MVHFANPIGGSVHAICTILASTSPVTLGGIGGVNLGLRSSALMGPTSHTLLRRRSKLAIESPLDFEAFSSVNDEPDWPQSISSIALAFWTLLAAVFFSETIRSTILALRVLALSDAFYLAST
jgi:hypothetical protein